VIVASPTPLGGESRHRIQKTGEVTTSRPNGGGRFPARTPDPASLRAYRIRAAHRCTPLVVRLCRLAFGVPIGDARIAYRAAWIRRMRSSRPS